MSHAWTLDYMLALCFIDGNAELSVLIRPAHEILPIYSHSHKVSFPACHACDDLCAELLWWVSAMEEATEGAHCSEVDIPHDLSLGVCGREHALVVALWIARYLVSCLETLEYSVTHVCISLKLSRELIFLYLLIR